MCLHLLPLEAFGQSQTIFFMLLLLNSIEKSYLNNWKFLFEPLVIKQGKKYYEDDLVDVIYYGDKQIVASVKEDITHTYSIQYLSSAKSYTKHLS